MSGLDNVVNTSDTFPIEQHHIERDPSPNRPTLKDVADHAGVSFKTVSRVVNGENGVSAVTTQRVQASIERLGYRRNHSARLLRNGAGTVGTVGIVHADVTNPFAAAVQAAFEHHLRTTADTLVFSGSSHADPAEQDRLIDAFTSRRVDGLAIIPSGSEPGPALRREFERGTPIVFVDREPILHADVVCSDNRGGAFLATEHLLSHGHRTIAFLGSRDASSSIRARREGFDAAIENAGAEAVIRTGVTSIEEAEDATMELLAPLAVGRPTAVFAAQNLAAAGAVRALHRLGLQHEIALVAFDHLETADLVVPRVTTIPQNAEELGRRAAELLLARIAGSDGAPRRVVVPVTLEPRGSGEIPPRQPVRPAR